MATYEPTNEQRAIVEADDSALVVAGPGRGKTVTAIAAARAWMERTPGSPAVLFTSFSNAAVRRIAAAAGLDPAGLEGHVQFRTIHGLAMEVLANYGRYAGLRRPARPLDSTEERLIAAERGWDQSDDRKRDAALRELSRDEGLVAFDLMVPLAASLLRASPTIRGASGCRYPFIIIDEFQDTRPEQWAFIRLLGEGSRVIALGDPNQMIYERQHQAAKRRMDEFCAWKGIEPVRFDGPNLRCQVGGIVTFAESLLRGRRHTPAGGDGVEFFPAYPNQRRAMLAAIWSAIRRQAGRSSSIAFIAPSSGAAQRLAAELREPDPASKVPLAVHARVETDEGALDAFRLTACAAVDWVRDRTEANKQVLAVALAVFSTRWSRRKLTTDRVTAIARRLGTDSRAASSLRDYLTGAPPPGFTEFADGLLTALENDKEFASAGTALKKRGIPNLRGIAVGQGSLFDDYRLARMNVGLQGLTISAAPTTLLSMYRAKGREFDFVVLARLSGFAADFTDFRMLLRWKSL